MNERDSLLPGPLGALARRWLWDIDIDSLPAWRRLVLWTLRIGQACWRDLAEGQLTLRAMSLVYTTLLSLVPLLAISFSVLKGFGVHNQVEPLLLGFLEPLGDQGVEISARIVGFVDNIKVGVLGFLGFVLLFYTVISLMQKIERAFNYTWRIGRERTLGQRFRDYFSVVVIGPVLVFSSLSITASIMSDAVVQALAAIDTLVVLMGRSELSEICRKLIKAGKDPETPAACVEWATTEEQRVAVGPLRSIAERTEGDQLQPPVVTVIGEVAALAAAPDTIENEYWQLVDRLSREFESWQS